MHTAPAAETGVQPAAGSLAGTSSSNSTTPADSQKQPADKLKPEDVAALHVAVQRVEAALASSAAEQRALLKELVEAAAKAQKTADTTSNSILALIGMVAMVSLTLYYTTKGAERHSRALSKISETLAAIGDMIARRS